MPFNTQSSKKLEGLSEINSFSFMTSCHYSEDIGVLLKQGKQFKGRSVHTTAPLAAKVQDILGPMRSSGDVGGGEVGRVIEGTVESTLSRCRAFKTDAEVACLFHANKVR